MQLANYISKNTLKRVVKVTGIVLMCLCLAYITFKISKSRDFQFFGGIVKSVDTDDKVIALTFDDGPNHNTDKIIEILGDLNVKATFYVTGREVKENMSEAEKLVKAGHELGNHSYSHQKMIFKTPWFVKNEIDKTNQLIKQAGYQGEIHFRPPYFKKLLFLPHYLAKNNINTILCDIEPETELGFKANAEQLSNYTIKHTKEGSIILLHIMYESRSEALKALPKIVNGLREKGFNFVTVSELFKGSKKNNN